MGGMETPTPGKICRMAREQGKDVTPEDCGVRDEFWEDTVFHSEWSHSARLDTINTMPLGASKLGFGQWNHRVQSFLPSRTQASHKQLSCVRCSATHHGTGATAWSPALLGRIVDLPERTSSATVQAS